MEIPLGVILTRKEIEDIRDMAAWIIDQLITEDQEYENVQDLFTKFSELARPTNFKGDERNEQL